jgi:hypothetical protein
MHESESGQMSAIKTSICKLSKSEIHQSLEQLANEIRTARYLCRKCGRAAHRKRLLCKPVPLSDFAPTAPLE